MALSVNTQTGSSYWVVPLENGNYNVMQDPDGAEGPAEAEAIAENASESEVNDVFVTRKIDLQLQNGCLTGGGATAFDSPYPVIGATTGRAAPSNAVSGAADWMNGTAGLNDAALMWMTLSIMARLSAQEVKDARMLRDIFKKGKIIAKQNEIALTTDKIAAERENLKEQMYVAIACAVVAIVCSAAGAGGNTAGSAAVTAFGSVVGTLGPAIANYNSKANGPQAVADKKQIEILRAQLEAELLDQAAEGSKENYEAAKKTLDDALKMILSHEEMVTQQIRSVHQA